MPLQKRGSKEECISYNYKEMIASGNTKKVAQAATLNFCNKKWGGIPKKKKSKHEELKYEIMFELLDLDMMNVELEKVKGLIQKVVKEKNIDKTTAEFRKKQEDELANQ